MRKILVFYVFILILSFNAAAYATYYRFIVPQAIVEVKIEPNASAFIHYWITFENHGDMIDIVDVGMPTENYGVIRAALDGVPVLDIRPSTYIDIGSEVHLSPVITKRGVFEFEGINYDMVYEDTTDPNYASFQFAPTWFDANLIFSTTILQVKFILPPGVNINSVRWQNERYDNLTLNSENRVVVEWTRNVELNKMHKFGVSFPKNVMQKVLEMSTWTLFKMWWGGVIYSIKGTQYIYIIPIISIILFAICFLSYIRGVGCLFMILLMLISSLSVFLKDEPVGTINFSIILSLISLLLIILRKWIIHRRKTHYFSPKLTVEGGGILMGLKAAEAAILLEYPLNNIISMVLFGLFRKGIIDISGQGSDVKLKIVGEKKSNGNYINSFQKKIVLNGYEIEILKWIDKKKTVGSEVKIKDINFADYLKDFIKDMERKIKGYDLGATKEFYKKMVEHAWLQVENSLKSQIDVQTKQDTINNNMDWLMMTNGWNQRLSNTVRVYPISVPMNWGTPSSVGTGLNVPNINAGNINFSDVVSSIVGKIENVSSSVVTNNFASLGKLDLGGSGGGGGHGGGHSCACACAGCACACACAGGGR